jgi:stearoyl-CoA desaturase (delta-9 desaturase)
MVKVRILSFLYLLAWFELLTFWAIDFDVWVYGLVGGWVFHMVICSIILHKYFTHRTFKVNKPLHYIFCYLGTLGLNGSVLAWVNMHRLHHATSDRANDPHDPVKIGFFKSLFVFKGMDYTNNMALTTSLKNCRDLLEDKAVMFFHKNTCEVVVATYVLVGLLSAKALSVLLIATAVSFIGLFFTTYVYHFAIPLLHYRNNVTPDKSHNNWLTTILFPGEAYHNNHHNNPSKYDTAERWFEFDLSAVIINLIKRESKND